jgi:hypothetical protein
MNGIMKHARAAIAIGIMASAVCYSPESAAEPPGEVAQSATYPIRVFYDTSLAEFVPQVMSDTEDAWQVVIVDQGLIPPLHMVGDVVEIGFDVVLDITIAGLAQYEIAGVDATTPATDCAMLNYFNPMGAATLDYIRMTVELLVARSSLRAVDCIEPVKPAYDMFGVAFGVLSMGDQNPYWLSSELPSFQSLPWNSLDYAGGSSTVEIFYPYGSALFTLFIDEAYGDGDGSFLVDVWNGTAQDGTIESWSGLSCTSDVENEPDYLDAIGTQLESVGASFDEAMVEFAEWRYFIGADDDGAHFVNAASWTGGEVARDTVLAAGDLPVDGMACANPVAELGTAYVEVDLAELGVPEEPLEVSFEAVTEGSSWSAVAYFIPSEGGAATIQPLTFTDADHGSLMLPGLSSYAKMVLAVVNLGDGDHDGDAYDWSTENGEFRFSIGPHADELEDAGVDAGDDAGTSASSDDGCACSAAVGGDVPRGSLLAVMLGIAE